MAWTQSKTVGGCGRAIVDGPGLVPLSMAAKGPGQRSSGWQWHSLAAAAWAKALDHAEGYFLNECEAHTAEG